MNSMLLSVKEIAFKKIDGIMYCIQLYIEYTYVHEYKTWNKTTSNIL